MKSRATLPGRNRERANQQPAQASIFRIPPPSTVVGPSLARLSFGSVGLDGGIPVKRARKSQDLRLRPDRDALANLTLFPFVDSSMSTHVTLLLRSSVEPAGSSAVDLQRYMPVGKVGSRQWSGREDERVDVVPSRRQAHPDVNVVLVSAGLGNVVRVCRTFIPCRLKS